MSTVLLILVYHAEIIKHCQCFITYSYKCAAIHLPSLLLSSKHGISSLSLMTDSSSFELLAMIFSDVVREAIKLLIHRLIGDKIQACSISGSLNARFFLCFMLYYIIILYNNII